jgi:predicted phage terminase large subunit-like protein
MGTLTPTEYRALLRADFCSFAQRCFHELNPQTRYVWGWYIELLAAKLADCYAGKIRRLIINLPPRYLKSHLASICLPAWWLGHNPYAKIMCASYSHALAENLARDCRTIMESAFYKYLFPTRLEQRSLGALVTTKGGFRFATSVGGTMTGVGGDVLIVDDPLKAKDALSGTKRKGGNDWFDGTAVGRLNNKKIGCIIVIGQRLHPDDIVGHLLEREPQAWEVVSLPAIAEQNETYAVETPLGRARFQRMKDEVLHPERESREVIDNLRKTIGEHNFAPQYQQAPVPPDGGMVKAKWIQVEDENQIPARFDLIGQSWDVAEKTDELNDYSVCLTFGVKANHFYLLDVFRARLDYPSLKRAVRERQKAARADVVLIEDKGTGIALIQELKAEVHGVTPYYPAGRKMFRLQTQTDIIAEGFLHVRKDAPGLEEFMAELTSFPSSKHDDQVDALSQFLDWVRRCRSAWEFCRGWSPPPAAATTRGETTNPGWQCAASGFNTGLTPPRNGVRFRLSQGNFNVVLYDGTIYWADPKTRIVVVRPEHAAQVERKSLKRLD